MAEVRVAPAASHFRADHSVRRVGFFIHGFAGKWCGKAGPSAPAVEFVQGGKERFSGNDVDIETWFFVIPESVSEGTFGGVFLSHLVLLRGKLGDGFRIFGVSRHGSKPNYLDVSWIRVMRQWLQSGPGEEA